MPHIIVVIVHRNAHDDSLSRWLIRDTLQRNYKIAIALLHLIASQRLPGRTTESVTLKVKGGMENTAAA
ncbi:hypothetical protein ES703_82085 [subsurface metagenome]